MGFCRQLSLLLKKNYLIQRRQWLWLVVELLAPLALYAILCLVRTRDLTKAYAGCHYTAKAMPSAGIMPFAQSLLCTIANQCHDTPTSGDMGEELRDINESLAINISRHALSVLNASGAAYHTLKPMSNDLVKIVHILANLNNTKQQETSVKFGDLIPEKIILKCIEEQPAAHIIAESELLPNFGRIIVREAIQKLGLTGILEFDPLIIADVSKVWNAIFCNATVVKEGIRSKDYKEVMKLCGQWLCFAFKIGSFNATGGEQFVEMTAQNVTGKDISFETAADLLAIGFKLRSDLQTEDIENLNKAITRLLEVVSVFNNLSTNPNLTQNHLINQLTCGQLDVINDRFASITQKVRREKDSEGRQRTKINLEQENKDPKPEFCGPINMTEADNFCKQGLGGSNSMLQSIFGRFAYILKGFILVTPDNPATRRVVDIISRPFQTIGSINSWLHYLWLDAGIYQRELADSELAKAIWNALDIIETINSTVVPVPINSSLIKQIKNYIQNSSNAGIFVDLGNFANAADEYMKCIRSSNRFLILSNETQMEEIGICLENQGLLLAGIVFSYDNGTDVASATQFEPLSTYKIRMEPGKTDGTWVIRDSLAKKSPRDDPLQDLKYITFGFSYLQDLIERAIIEIQTNASPPELGIYAQQFPSPCYFIDVFHKFLPSWTPFLTVMSFVLPFALAVKNVVYEKERRLKEVMKVMGLGNMVHWFAWFIQIMSVATVAVCFCVLLLKVGDILPRTDWSLLLFFFLLYNVAIITQAFLLSTLFSQANLAAAVAAVIYVSLYFPYGLLYKRLSDLSIKLATCLLAQTALGWGMKAVSDYETEEIGLTWSNSFETLYAGGFAFGYAALMLMADIVIHMILTWYIETVFPGQYGIPLPFYFPFQRSYWCGQRPIEKSPEDQVLAEHNNIHSSNDFEPDPTNLKAGVVIENLRKVYSNGNLAVDGLSVNFYETQITSFLGHNGAGKTTTLSILCGLYPATTGTVTINDLDVRTQIHKIRKSLGFCPQHNVLFDILGVEEQLRFYAGLKGVKNEDMDVQMDKILKDVGLIDKRKALAKNLSGGMQRKLSIAIAFIGNCRTVILDEPTAGVDPFARRAIWDLLIKYKPGRTIILSTHHMDEADVLGDRIAIVVDGHLRCSGSSLFLRRRFGSGYRLTLVRDPSLYEQKLPDLVGANRLQPLENGAPAVDLAPNNSAPLPPIGRDESQKRAIKSLVAELMPQAHCIESVGAEMVFAIPRTEPAKLREFFDALDREQTTMAISSYGVSDTSMEEIFLKTVVGQRLDTLKTVDTCCDCCPFVNRLLHVDKMWSETKRKMRVKNAGEIVENLDQRNLVGDSSDEELDFESHDATVAHPEVKKIAGGSWKLYFQRVKALLIKRFHNFKRNKKGAFCELLLPVIVVALAMLLVQSVRHGKLVNQPPMAIRKAMYTNRRDPVNYVHFSLASNRSLDVARSLVEPPGMGLRCMEELQHSRSYPCLRNQSVWLYPDGPAPFGYNVSYNGCFCDSRSDWNCSELSYHPRPKRRFLNTSDYMIDMTDRNISQWILMTWNQYLTNRYGGFTLGQYRPKAMEGAALSEEFGNLSDLFLDTLRRMDIDLASGGNSSVVSAFQAIVRNMETKKAIMVWYLNRGWISFPAYMNTVSNSLLRMFLPANESREDYGILLINHPMNYTEEKKTENAAQRDLVQDVFMIVLIILAFSIVPASFVLFLIDERVTHSKHLQFVSGIVPRLYWTSNLVWDMVNFTLPVVLVIIIFFIFDNKAYTYSGREVFAVFLLLMLYGFAVIPLMYIFTFVFSVPPWAFVILGGGNLFIGMVSTIAAAILRSVVELYEDEVLSEASRICDIVFLIFPQFCLGDGLMDMNMALLERQAGVVLIGKSKRELFSWPVLGNKYLWLFLQGVTCFAFVLIIEYRHRIFSTCARRHRLPPVDQSEDEDIKSERGRVDQQPADSYGLLIKNLSKVYSTCFGTSRLRAVQNLTVGVSRGECFGLLGLNGAGKTTTFKMITGKIPITRGDAVINGLSVRKSMRELYQVVGYCPQFDALNAHLTGREQLAFYARIRGIEEKDLNKVINWAIEHMHLTIYGNNETRTYSGGNKRKLSTAIALVGNPLVVLLDEPSTGMDPKTRRFMWNRIIELTKHNHTVVLTSHSMEECEALCTRVGIMVGGKMKCLGSVQHLKKKFGEGYRLTLKLHSIDSSGHLPLALTQAVAEEFKNSQLEDRHHLTLTYRIPAGAMSVSEAFAAIERLRSRVDLDDYALSQTTLDDVFVNFAAANKTEEQEVKPKQKLSRSLDIPLNDRSVPNGTQPQPTVGSAPAAVGALGEDLAVL